MEKKQTKGDLTREKILKETVLQFGRHGFFSTSFQMIADGCGMGQMAVIRHYPNKNVLLMEVLNLIMARNYKMVENLIQPQDDAKTGLLKYCEANLQWAIKYPEEAQIILLLYYTAAYDDEFSEIFEKVLQGGRKRVLNYFYSAVREKIISLPTEKIESTAELFHEALMGIIINVISSRGTISKRNFKTALIKLENFLELLKLK